MLKWGLITKPYLMADQTLNSFNLDPGLFLVTEQIPRII